MSHLVLFKQRMYGLVDVVADMGASRTRSPRQPLLNSQRQVIRELHSCQKAAGRSASAVAESWEGASEGRAAQ